jgi:hypothetical protein
MSYFELAIIAFILLGICFLLFRGGQANPEGTGRLARRIGKVEQTLAEKATTESVDAARSELAALSAKVGKLETEMAGDRRVNQLTYEAVRRLENFFLQRGTGA